MIRIVFIGPPGSGKGTQARLISNKYNIPNISTGLMLRKIFTNYSFKNHNKTKQKIVNVMHTGDLVNDAFMLELINTRINEIDCYNGFLLDGFPRTIVQALSMEKYNITIDYIIEFVIPDDIVINRITGRRVHIASGRTYHIKFNPPQNNGIDDITGDALTMRKDDCREAIIKRLHNYYQYTKPLLNYYRKRSKNKKIRYFSVDGNREISEIYEELINVIHE